MMLSRIVISVLLVFTASVIGDTSSAELVHALMTLIKTVHQKESFIQALSNRLHIVDNFDQEFTKIQRSTDPWIKLDSVNKKKRSIIVNCHFDVFTEFIKHNGEFLFLNDPSESAKNIRKYVMLPAVGTSDEIISSKTKTMVKMMKKLDRALLLKVFKDYTLRVKMLQDSDQLVLKSIAELGERANVNFKEHFADFWFSVFITDGQLNFLRLTSALSSKSLSSSENDNELISLKLISPNRLKPYEVRLPAEMSLRQLNSLTFNSEASGLMQDSFTKPYLVLISDRGYHGHHQHRYLNCRECSLFDAEKSKLVAIFWDRSFFSNLSPFNFVNVYNHIVMQLGL